MKMKLIPICLIVACVFILPSLGFTQFTHKIKADSVRIYNDNCTAELIVENSTSNIKGFLFNKGMGRTEFRKAVIKLNDSSFLIGGDTLTIKPVFNGLLPGSVLFYDGTVINQDNDNFYWDNTNKRLGIGTNTPQYKLDISAYSTTAPQIRAGSLEFQSYSLNNTWFGDNAYYDGSGFRFRNAGNAGLFYFAGSEGQFRFMSNGLSNGLWPSATGGADNNGNTQLKINANGTVALGGLMTYVQGNFTDAGMIVKPLSVLIGTTSDDGQNKLQVNGYVKASGFRIPTGTSLQFLKADGTLDNNTYLTSSALAGYLPLTGGTLTGTLNGTNASFTGEGNFGGNVGIGTTSPEGVLHIVKSNAGGTGGQLVIDNPNSSTVGNAVEISFLTDAGASAGPSGTRNARLLVVNENAGDGRANMQFHTWNGSSSAERGRITSAGRWLFGTTTDDGSSIIQANGDILISTDKSLKFGTSGGSGKPEINMDASASFNFKNTAGVTTFSLSNGGIATFNSSVTAASFSGAGTGLTGYAANLNIGGNATSATYLQHTNVGASVLNANSFGYGRASNYYGAAQISNVPDMSYGSLYNFGGTDASALSLQVFTTVNHNSSSSTRGFWYRTGNNLGFQNDWRRVIDNINYNEYTPTLTGQGASGTWPISITGNANYASSAGSVAWSNVSGRPTALSQFTNDLSNYGNWQPLENQRLSTSNDVSFGNIYSNGWLRNNNANEGIYNQALANHFYASNNAYWNIAGSNGNYGGLVLRDNHNGPIKGYYYWDGSGAGLLTNQGNWAVRLNYGGGYPGGQLYGSWTGTISNAQRADRANGNFYIDDNYGNSIIGNYASTRYQGIYAMGASYKLPDDGSHPGTLYGLAWTHDNVGGQAKSGLGHQMLVMENGVTQTAIGNGIWTRANIVTTNYGSAAQWNDKATHRSEGTNYIDYSRYVYNNGAYSGSGWVEPSDLGVRYANSAGSATHASYLGGHYYDSYIGKFGGSYYQTNTWQQFNGSFGLYWPSPGISAYGGSPHFYPNSSSPYGSFTIVGSRNGYSGLHLNDASGTVVGMYDGAGNGGDYDVNTGWHFYWNRANNSLGIGGSATASGYKMYVNGSSYVDGNIVTSSYGSAAQWNDKATHRGEGTNFIDYSRYVYNNGAYSGSGWVEPSDLGVRYANSAGSASSATNSTNATYGRYVYNNGAYSGSGWVEASDMGVRYASTAGSTTVWYSQTHPSTYYLVNNWDGYYWDITSNHGNGVKVAYSTISGTANTANSVDWSNINNKPAVIHKTNTPASYSSTPTIRGDATGSTDNIGVMGIGSYGSNYNVGLHGEGNYAGTTGIGVYGNAYGAPSSNYGIYAGAGGGNWNYAGYFNGVVYSSSYFTTSDLRVKKNVVDEETILSKVKKLRAVSFDYDKGNRSLNLPTEKQHGFIAQELQQVFPESVKLIKNPIFEGNKYKGEEEVLGINYQSLIPILVKALQEQDGVIEALKKRIEQLEKKN